MRFPFHITPFLLVMLFITSCSTTRIVVDNQLPRQTTDGQIVDAHDGRIIRFGDRYYWYGTRYGSTNGFTEANEYVCYSSADLKSWRFENTLLPNKARGVYYRPHVVYNAATKKYVLWYNWYPKLWEGQFGVATSDSPTGPFQVLHDDARVRHSSLGVGDLGLFVDEDGKAYLSYNTINGHRVSVEQLDDAYTASTMEGSEFIAQHVEAGAMFKRNNVYYLLTDYTCCFCTQGSGARVYTAAKPLGPYAFRQNINRYPGEAVPSLTNGSSRDNLYETVSAKNGATFHVSTEDETSISSVTIAQFTGDRKGQCGEVNNPQVHEPIPDVTFTLTYMRDGEWLTIPDLKKQVRQESLLQVHEVSFAPLRTDQLRIKAVPADTARTVHFSEIALNDGGTVIRVFRQTGQEGKPIIPAQQAFVMQLHTKKGKAFIWIGDLWGSASDNIKGHDYQYWSAPLRFHENGLIHPLRWTDKWTLKTKNK